MYYSKEQRIEIGRRVYTKEISFEEASAEYSVPKKTLYNYVAEYKEGIGLKKESFRDCFAILMLQR